ncbi:hypothetical protein ACIRPU_41040 [Streptomyces sp. NPDC102259]|uniref:hypothetical protein n=1 Tax=Streptomyces sp. NPDC102259 TaxID=3366148 RepID=UPI00380B3B44
MLGLILNGIGQGLAFPAMTISLLSGVDQRRHGAAGAVNVTAQQIGSSVVWPSWSGWPPPRQTAGTRPAGLPALVGPVLANTTY